LRDARSIIMLRATRMAKQRATSNIRWNYGHTTIPRHLRDIVVTEYGIADLRGKNDRDVIAAMLAITDSRFQDELTRRAKDAGKIEKSFELPRECRDNTPERLEKALAPAREQGVIPPVPFRSDFPGTTPRLLPGPAPRRCGSRASPRAAYPPPCRRATSGTASPAWGSSVRQNRRSASTPRWCEVRLMR